MITDIDILYNRHILSKHQIETHFGKTDDTLVSPSDDVFQNVESFFEIVDALQTEKIDFIPLKGPVLSHLLYQNYACRRFYDLDFLVDFANMERISILLAGLGYQPVIKWPSTPGEKRKLRNNNNQFLFQHQHNKTDVEIHWRLFKMFKFPDISFEKLYNELTLHYTLEGRSFRKLSNELELLFLLIHGAKHAWFRLKWLIDVNDYIKNVDIDVNILHELAAKNGFLNMIYYYNTMAEAFIPNSFNIPVKSKTIPYYIKRYTKKEIFELQKRDLRIRTKKSARNLIDVALLDLYLAPDFYSGYKAIKRFLVEALPKSLLRLLKPIDQLINF